MIRILRAPVRAALLGSGLAAVSAAGLLVAAPTAGAIVAAPAAATHTIRVQGVTLHVPKSWHVDYQAHQPGCVVDSRAASPSAGERGYGVNDCQLQVLAGRHLPSQAVPNKLYFPGDPAQCLRGDRAVGFTTVTASSAHIGAASAQFRRFSLPCLTTPLEQWYSGHQPGLLIQRTRASSGTETAARRAVTSARVASGHGTTRGFTGTPRGAGRTTVLLAPTRIYYHRTGHSTAVTTKGRNQLFQVPASARIVYVDYGANPHELSRGQFLRDVRNGFPHTHGLQPQVTVQSADGAHRISRITVELARATKRG